MLDLTRLTAIYSHAPGRPHRKMGIEGRALTDAESLAAVRRTTAVLTSFGSAMVVATRRLRPSEDT